MVNRHPTDLFAAPRMQNKSPNHAEHVGIHSISIGCILECSNLEVFERNCQVKRGHIMGLILGDGQKMLDIVETLGLQRTFHFPIRWSDGSDGTNFLRFAAPRTAANVCDAWHGFSIFVLV